jgi:hypothetical protein
MRSANITASLRASAALAIVEDLHAGNLLSYLADRRAEMEVWRVETWTLYASIMSAHSPDVGELSEAQTASVFTYHQARLEMDAEPTADEDEQHQLAEESPPDPDLDPSEWTPI